MNKEPHKKISFADYTQQAYTSLSNNASSQRAPLAFELQPRISDAILSFDATCGKMDNTTPLVPNNTFGDSTQINNNNNTPTFFTTNEQPIQRILPMVSNAYEIKLHTSPTATTTATKIPSPTTYITERRGVSEWDNWKVFLRILFATESGGDFSFELESFESKYCSTLLSHSKATNKPLWKPRTRKELFETSTIISRLNGQRTFCIIPGETRQQHFSLAKFRVDRGGYHCLDILLSPKPIYSLHFYALKISASPSVGRIYSCIDNFYQEGKVSLFGPMLILKHEIPQYSTTTIEIPSRVSQGDDVSLIELSELLELSELTELSLGSIGSSAIIDTANETETIGMTSSISHTTFTQPNFFSKSLTTPTSAPTTATTSTPTTTTTFNTTSVAPLNAMSFFSPTNITALHDTSTEIPLTISTSANTNTNININTNANTNTTTASPLITSSSTNIFDNVNQYPTTIINNNSSFNMAKSTLLVREHHGVHGFSIDMTLRTGSTTHGACFTPISTEHVTISYQFDTQKGYGLLCSFICSSLNIHRTAPPALLGSHPQAFVTGYKDIEKTPLGGELRVFLPIQLFENVCYTFRVCVEELSTEDLSDIPLYTVFMFIPKLEHRLAKGKWIQQRIDDSKNMDDVVVGSIPSVSAISASPVTPVTLAAPAAPAASSTSTIATVQAVANKMQKQRVNHSVYDDDERDDSDDEDDDNMDHVDNEDYTSMHTFYLPPNKLSSIQSTSSSSSSAMYCTEYQTIRIAQAAIPTPFTLIRRVNSLLSLASTDPRSSFSEKSVIFGNQKYFHQGGKHLSELLESTCYVDSQSRLRSRVDWECRLVQNSILLRHCGFTHITASKYLATSASNSPTSDLLLENQENMDQNITISLKRVCNHDSDTAVI